MYLAWYDADRKKPLVQKIADARARYVQKFNAEPVVVLVNPEDACAVDGLEVRALPHIGRHCFWVGKDDEGDGR